MLRHVQQARVFELAFDLVVAPRLRIVEVVRDVFVEFLVLVVGDLGARSGPQRLRRVDRSPTRRPARPFSSPLLVVGVDRLLHHLDRDADVIGILAHDVAQPIAVGEFLRVVFQMQRHVGAARRLRVGRNREVRFAARTPPRRGVFRLVRSSRQHVDAVGHDERAVETDTELTDQRRVLFAIAGELRQELGGTRLRNRAEICDRLFARHADAVVGDRDRASPLRRPRRECAARCLPRAATDVRAPRSAACRLRRTRSKSAPAERSPCSNTEE